MHIEVTIRKLNVRTIIIYKRPYDTICSIGNPEVPLERNIISLRVNEGKCHPSDPEKMF